MGKRLDWIETIGIGVSVLSLVTMCFFHISWKRYLGIDETTWDIIGSISENVLFITMCLLIWASRYSPIVSKFFIWLCPYFLIKLTYHITCALNIRLWSKEVWENVWSVIAAVYIGYLFIICYQWVKKRK